MTSERIEPRIEGFVPRPDLPHTTQIPVLGIPTRFESNSADVLAMVAEDFGAWRTASELAANDEGHVVRIVVHEAAGPDDGPLSVRSTDDGRLVLHTGQSVAVVDPMRRESLAYVSSALVAQEERFREEVLAAITFALLDAFDRHPVHAAAVAHAGRALLLAGPSGAGKSTLACLAHLEGFRLMSDDLVWVQLEPKLRIWANTRGAHLRADALEKLAITDTHPVVRERDGKRRISLGAVVRAEPWVAVDDARVCILVPGRTASLEALVPAAVEKALDAQTAPGFDRFPSRHPDVLKALAAPGGWRLTLSEDPRDTLPYIQAMLGVTTA